ncbi:MAG TPA: hypothetical protein GXZ77_03595 [Papillibacter sp.]|jgi:hypothetical protein|nr:hypothetical protein [Papillibacter sp.]
MSTRKRRFGDRYDGRLLRTLEPYSAIGCFIMKKRNDANNAYMDAIEITEIEKFIRQKRAEGMPGLGMLHIFIAAYIRLVSQMPHLNRFVAGQRVYHHHHVDVVMIVKQDMTSTGVESSIKVRFEKTDTLSDVYRKIDEAVKAVKAQKDGNADVTAKILTKIPRLVVAFFIGLLKLLDYFGLMPKFLIDTSLFHGSLFLSDLGSLGIRPVLHHLYNFGTIPVFLTFGVKRRAYEMQADGSVAERKYIDFTVMVDDRITDGFYLAQCIKYLRSYMRYPHQLEKPPEKVVEDIE